MRLIDADKADVEFISCYYGNHCYIEEVQEWLDEQPTIDAEPVVHGEWIMRGGRRYCSACGQMACVTRDREDFWYTCGTNYCPNCGADMRERKET